MIPFLYFFLCCFFFMNSTRSSCWWFSSSVLPLQIKHSRGRKKMQKWCSGKKFICYHFNSLCNYLIKEYAACISRWTVMWPDKTFRYFIFFCFLFFGDTCADFKLCRHNKIYFTINRRTRKNCIIKLLHMITPIIN